ncbi:MAG: tetratricopeptide repeat protein [Chlamydiota bacterium]|nr:tetratricopeptide repeat protein [Chlamydiota bacterium]
MSLCVTLPSCTMSSTAIEPNIKLKTTKYDIARIPSAFDPLTPKELSEEWARELLIGNRFAKDLDLYRAITSFKRSLILMPENRLERRLQAEFAIVQCYYLAAKYCDAIESFENSQLLHVSPTFPAFRDLLIIMHDCYDKTKEFDRAEQILKVIEKGDSNLANNIQLSIAISEGDIPSTRALAQQSSKCEPINEFIQQYCKCSLSPKKAQILNAILPGAGYYYVGQKRAAVTSLLLNGLFSAATYYFFDNGNWAAGLITLSLETGWYIGGINGAGLEAKEYNEHLYNNMGKGTMTRNDLFPLLMLETNF